MNKRFQAKNDLIKFLTDDINNPDAVKQNEMIPIERLIPYENHPFKLYEGERFSDMVRSIKEMGVLLPVIVRPVDSYEKRYEILSGHNRVNAAREAGLSEVPVIIKHNISDDEAELIVTETNLIQRSFSDLLHSERAIALKCHLDAIKHQGRRTDLINEINSLLNTAETGENSTSYLLETKSRSNEKIGDKYGLSRANVARYIRLNFLNSELQSRVDKEEMGLYAAVSISYLSPEEQTVLNQILDETQYRINMKKAETLRSYSETKKLTKDNMILILSGKLGKKTKTKSSAPPFKIKHKIYAKYFDDTVMPNEAERIIDKALEEYFRVHLKKGMR